MTRPLLVSHDTTLLDDLLRLAAAAGVEVHVAPDVDAARAHWRAAPLVILDSASALQAHGRLPRRDGVLLVLRTPDPKAWHLAVAVGAEHVAELPDAERWLIARLVDGGEGPSREGRIIVVRGAVGGAGASTLASTLALAAGRRGRALLIDADALGGGIDLLLGGEDVAGARWPDLAQAHGRVSASSLAAALPVLQGLSVLSAVRTAPHALDPDVVDSVLDAAERGFDVTVVDAPSRDPILEVLRPRMDAEVLLVPARTRAVLAARAQLTEALPTLHVVMREEPRGLSEAVVAEALGRPIDAVIPFQRSLAARSDNGECPSLRDAYGRAASRVLESVTALALDAA